MTHLEEFEQRLHELLDEYNAYICIVGHDNEEDLTLEIGTTSPDHEVGYKYLYSLIIT